MGVRRLGIVNRSIGSLPRANSSGPSQSPVPCTDEGGEDALCRWLALRESWMFRQGNPRFSYGWPTCGFGHQDRSRSGIVIHLPLVCKLAVKSTKVDPASAETAPNDGLRDPVATLGNALGNPLDSLIRRGKQEMDDGNTIAACLPSTESGCKAPTAQGGLNCEVLPTSDMRFHLPKRDPPSLKRSRGRVGGTESCCDFVAVHEGRATLFPA